MGCTVKEKHIRTSRKSRSSKHETAHSAGNTTICKPMMESELKSLYYQMGLNGYCQKHKLNSGPDVGSSSVFNDNGWGYCTEEQLEEILMKNLELLYNEVIAKLVVLGYANDEDTAMKAVLGNGHCHGEMDVFTNILHNSSRYLVNGRCLSDLSSEYELSFTNLKQVVEHTLSLSVYLLQQIKPHLSQGDAMWCLLMSDLHVGRASTMEFPVPHIGNDACNDACGDSSGDDLVDVASALCRFHGGWCFENDGTLEKEIECPKRFNLTPSMKKLLNRNVGMFAAGFRANVRQLHGQLQSSSSPFSSQDSSDCGDKCVTVERQNTKNQDVNSVMSKFHDLNLDEKNTEQNVSLGQKDEMVLNLVHQIKDLEKQVKERKDWAHQKAMQAARKLSNDLTELKTLRIEREDNPRFKNGKQNFEDSTLKRLSAMENALRKASSQVDRANSAVRKLENENAEIRAEIEASKLNASESVMTCLEVSKREKKYLKKLLAWEKQKLKLQEDIESEKQKIANKEQQLAGVEEVLNDYQAKWRQEQKSKELAIAQLEEHQRLKKNAEANSKRRLEALRLKIEIDFQRHKDDYQRLEQELTRLKSSASENNEHGHGHGHVRTNAESIENLVREFEKLETLWDKEGSYNNIRVCSVCMNDEVCVVFLPCAHQVLCANCNEGYGQKGKFAVCPSCRVPIERRIRVFGATS